jgi:putative ABC transport system ATP-binding protein
MLISLRGIYKHFNDHGNKVTVLNDLDLDVDKGEMIAIMGASGSGKSTLLKIMSLILPPEEGAYTYAGKDMLQNTIRENTKFRNQTIGFIFQDFALLEEDSVYDNIILPLRFNPNTKHSEWKHRAMETSKLAGIDALLKSKVRRLSGGEKQRVAIARAIVANQELILADEPTGSLDKINKQHILELFQDLNKNGHTILIVTHDPEVANTCDRILHLQEGKLVSR